MTASSTIISLCNRSLLSFGARATINSLTENSTEAQACNVFVQSTFEQLARTARWGCLRKEANLSLLAAAIGTPENAANPSLPVPPQPFLYMYAMPSDSLFIRGLQPFIQYTSTGTFPSTSVNNSITPCLPNEAIPFKVGYSTDINNNPIEVILTNLDQAIGVYTVNQPNPIVWDSLLEQAFVSALAAFLIPAISLNHELMAAMIKNAEMCIATARLVDGNETPVNQNREASWMAARRAGDGFNGTASSYSGYQNMNWPGAYGGGGGIS